jgi:hypothetical protein
MKTQAILIAAVALILGTAAGLIKDPSGTADKLKNPETESDNLLLRPAPNTRKVLPNLGKYIFYVFTMTTRSPI